MLSFMSLVRVDSRVKREYELQINICASENEVRIYIYVHISISIYIYMTYMLMVLKFLVAHIDVLIRYVSYSLIS